MLAAIRHIQQRLQRHIIYLSFAYSHIGDEQLFSWRWSAEVCGLRCSEGPGRAGEAAGPIDEVPGRRSQSAVTTPRVVPAGNKGRARLMRSVIFIVVFVVSPPAATSSARMYNPTTLLASVIAQYALPAFR